MAAGLGFKTFTTGEVLTAADTNGYLMQGVLVFASAAARDAAITSPQEGQFAYLKDTNVTTYYTGSAWANLDTTGMTNPMTTTGDMVYSSSGSTPARLGIGSTGQVMTVASGIPSWATPAAASSGMTLISRSSFSNVAGTNIDSVFTSTYKTYLVVVERIYGATPADDFYFQWRYSGTTQSANYNGNNAMLDPNGSTWSITQVSGAAQFTISRTIGDSTYDQSVQIYCNNVGNASEKPSLIGQGMMAGFYNYGTWFCGMTSDARTYTGFRLSSQSSNITGVVSVYGLATS